MIPRKSEYMMATAPASVGVKSPMRMPPMMMIGRHSGRNAALSAVKNSSGVARSVRMGLYPRRWEMIETRIIIAMQSRIPGPTPPTKSLPMERFAIEP